MGLDIKGINVLNAMTKLGEPATVREIAEQLKKRVNQPLYKLEPMVKKTLSGGVRYGFVQKFQNYYYSLTDGIEAIQSIDQMSISSVPYGIGIENSVNNVNSATDEIDVDMKVKTSEMSKTSQKSIGKSSRKRKSVGDVLEEDMNNNDDGDQYSYECPNCKSSFLIKQRGAKRLRR